MAIYNDDEPIAESSTQPDLDSDSDSEPAAQEAGDTQLTYFNRTEASLKASNMKVLLELTASDRVEDRFPLDLVAVLDVSESMESKKKKRTSKDEESKLLKLKRAMQFLIRKLSPTDRLSIVTFSTKSKRLFPLRLMTDKAQDESIEHVKEIKAVGRTNTAAGLKEGLKILSERRFTEERTAAIMLMSDGEQSPEFDEASEVDLIDQFPVYTFAFGKESTPEGLVEIADKSDGGTYTDVKEEKNLSRAFALCLGGLLTVVVKDMNLTVKPTEGESEIEDVSAGKYYDEKKDNSNDNSKFISFGDLYSKEVRKILVYIRLLPRTEDMSVDVLETRYTYVSTSKKKKGKRFDAPPVKITVDRFENAPDEEIPKVIIEYKRAQTVDCVEEARKLADNGEFPAATRKMEEAKKSLEEAKDVDDPEMIIKALLEEVEKLLKVMESPETYEEQGKSLIASFLSSQNLQRAVEGQLLYVTPLMLEYVRQAVEHDKDPSKPPPKPEDDLKADKGRREKEGTERKERQKEAEKAKEAEKGKQKAPEAKKKEEEKEKGPGFFGQLKADLEKKLNEFKHK